MQFKGTKNYISTEDLSMAVNAARALERPLLVKGEPGTGKTLLAIEVANALGMDLIEWHIKSTTKASQGLYEYDAVTRLRDSQLGDERVKDISNYIKENNLNVDIEIDGGVNYETGKLCVEAGANILVAGSFLFKQDDLTIATNEINDFFN